MSVHNPSSKVQREIEATMKETFAKNNVVTSDNNKNTVDENPVSGISRSIDIQSFENEVLEKTRKEFYPVGVDKILTEGPFKGMKVSDALEKEKENVLEKASNVMSATIADLSSKIEIFRSKLNSIQASKNVYLQTATANKDKQVDHLQQEKTKLLEMVEEINKKINAVEANYTFDIENHLNGYNTEIVKYEKLIAIQTESIKSIEKV